MTLVDRAFVPEHQYRLDEFGFLDCQKTPNIFRLDAILSHPIVWILGPPWIGKSKVAESIETRLRFESDLLPNVSRRFALTDLGALGTSPEIPPPWWSEWLRDSGAGEVIWLIDGVDEGFDRNRRSFQLILEALSRVPQGHLRRLCLVLFTRPHAELDDFRVELDQLYIECLHGRNVPQLWLARLETAGAKELVGSEHFLSVCEVIRRNNLQDVSGFPIVLKYLKTYPEMARLTVPEVWRGILASLLGERTANPRAGFVTLPQARFGAACRIALLLALTRRSTIREYSPAPDELTIPTVCHDSDNSSALAAREACHSAAFMAAPESGAYQFTHKHVQDWFAAFLLAELPISALHSALVGREGAVVAQLHDAARLARDITDREDVRTKIDQLFGGVTLPSDALHPSLAAVCQRLDQLENLARNAPWGLQIGGRRDELARLATDGLSDELARRLLDPERSQQVKRLLLEVAEATNAIEVPDAAVKLALDASQDNLLRMDATWYVTQCGSDAHLLKLAALTRDGAYPAEIDARLAGIVVDELLSRQLWPAWTAALHVPPEESHSIDHRAAAMMKIETSMTIMDANALLPHWRRLYQRHFSAERGHRPTDFLQRAIDIICEQESPPQDDIDALVGLAIEFTQDDDIASLVAEDIASRTKENQRARLRLYEHNIEAQLNGRSAQIPIARWHLKPDDWNLLLEQAQGRWSSCRQVWEDVYRQARWARSESRLSDGEWDALLVVIDEHMPGLTADFEEGQKEHEEQLAEQRRKLDESTPPRHSLRSVVEKLLDDETIGDDKRMRDLALACFVEGWWRNIDGSFDELSFDVKGCILSACQRGLDVAAPTKIPEEGPFPASILGEGAAFIQMISDPERQNWATEIQVEKWLPTALFANRARGWTKLIRDCANISKSITEKVLIETISGETRRQERPFILREIPTECWTDTMTLETVAILSGDNAPPSARRELLEQLVGRDAEYAKRIAMTWAGRPVANDEGDQLRQAGLNVLLCIEPSAAIDLIEAGFVDRGRAALEELPVLWAWSDELRAKWDRWQAVLLERLSRMLLAAFPLANDPPFRDGFVTPDRELRRVRDQIITFVLRHTDPEFLEMLDRVGQLDLSVRDRIATHRASEQAGRLLQDVTASPIADGDVLSVSEAVKLIDRAGYRLIRSEDDLLDAVVEAINDIQTDIGHDLPMLYGPPKRTEGGGARKHLEEDALQAYSRRRLSDLLKHRVDGVQMDIVKEEQLPYRRRLDLRVLAPCHGSGRLATVVIEIKWSTNSEVRTALVDQLGNKYLRGERLTHGVFFVGWTGEWTLGDGSGANVDIDTLIQHLNRQRDVYVKEGEAGSGLRIEPVVLDIRWKHEQP